MPIRSVLEVDVQDDKFRQFHRTFQQYQEALARTPSAWKDATGHIVRSGGALANLVDRLLMGRSELDKAYRTQQDFNRALAEAPRHMDVFGRATGDATRHMGALERTTRNVAYHLLGATRDILKWGSITSALGSLAGFGGLFGLRALGERAAGDYRTATGLGVSPGQLRALRTVLPYIADPEALLAASAASRANLIGGERIAGTMIGVDPRADPFEQSLQVLQRARQFALTTPEEQWEASPMGGFFRQRGIDTGTLRRLRQETPEGFQGELNEARRFARRAEQDEQTSQAWRRLMLDLGEAATLIENAFIKGLTPLVPQIGHLSQEFTKLVEVLLQKGGPFEEFIDAATQGLKWLADNINQQWFKDDVKGFLTGVGDMAKAIGRFVAWIGGTVGGGGGDSLQRWADEYAIGLQDKVRRGELTQQQAQEDWRRVAGVLPPGVQRGTATQTNLQNWMDQYAAGLQAQVTSGQLTTEQAAADWRRVRTSVPPSMTGDQAGIRPGEATVSPALLDLIKKYESGGNYGAAYGLPLGMDVRTYPLGPYGFPNYPGGMGPKGWSHAAGAYEIQPGLWNKYAPGLGIRDFSQESQDRVVAAILAREGLTPWASNPKVIEGVRRLLGQMASAGPATRDQGGPARNYDEAVRRDVGRQSSLGYGQQVAVNLRVDNRTGGSAFVSGSQLGALA